MAPTIAETVATGLATRSYSHPEQERLGILPSPEERVALRELRAWLPPFCDQYTIRTAPADTRARLDDFARAFAPLEDHSAPYAHERIAAHVRSFLALTTPPQISWSERARRNAGLFP